MRSRPLLPFLLALLAALLVAGCSAEAEVSIGDKTINDEQAEEQIGEALAEANNAELPKSLDCPDGVDAVKGESFTCGGEAPNGQPFEIEVTMTDDQGGIRYPTAVEFTGPPPATQ